MDQQLMARILLAFETRPSLLETDQLLHELATIRDKDNDIHELADALLEYRSSLTRVGAGVATQGSSTDSHDARAL